MNNKRKIERSFKDQIATQIESAHPHSNTSVNVFLGGADLYLTVVTHLQLSRGDTVELFSPVFKSDEFKSYTKHVSVTSIFEEAA